MSPDLLKCRIFVSAGITDMRKSINGLSAMVSEQMELNPLGGDLFLFSNGGKLLKALYWDRNGFCLWQKRLEKHRFPWPKAGNSVVELSDQQLKWLLAGIDFFNAHEELKFSSVN